MLLTIHVAAGGVAMILGAIALSVKKGSTLHRRSGLLFVYAMLVMGFTASILGLLKSVADPNVFAGLMTAYFVGTSLTTVRPSSAWTRVINCAALGIAVFLAIGSIAGGLTLIGTPGLDSGGVPFRTKGVMSLIIATVLTLSAIGDVRALRAGVLRGAARLKRHLWRMCFALFIAAGSFFSIRERVAAIFPAALTSGPVRLLPIALIFGAMFYWLWKLRKRGKLPALVLTPEPRGSCPS